MPLWKIASMLARRAAKRQASKAGPFTILAVVLTFIAAPVLGIAAFVVFADDNTAFGSAPVSVAGLPDVWLQAYTRAVTLTSQNRPNCRGLTWAMIAAIAQVESSQASGHQIGTDGKVTPPIYGPRLDGSTPGTEVVKDTDHGVLDGDTQYDRAVGPLQILPSTWTDNAVDATGSGHPDPQNVYDATATAAALLCGTGTVDLSNRTQLSAQILNYNHSQTYVTEVLSWIDDFDAVGPTGTVGASTVGGKIVAAASSQIGMPYSWGGGGADGPSLGFCDAQGDGMLNGSCSASVTVGFDCSGLAQYAAARAGVSIPRGASDQMNASGYAIIPATQGLSVLQPGDLVFFGDPAKPSTIHHVGIYAGGGDMIDCAHTGTSCQTEAVWLDEYAGAVRL